MNEDVYIIKERRAFLFSMIICLFFMSLEIIGGIFANSLALISDALHMSTDAGALFLGMIVTSISRRPKTKTKTFGYHRAEILGALANGLILWMLMGFLLYKAITRIFHPQIVTGPIVFIVASIGLFANIFMAKLLNPKHHGHGLNIKAAYFHVLSDLITSVGVIISGIIIWTTSWYLIDPIITIIFAIIILITSGRMILQAINILMESTPSEIDIQKVSEDLLNIQGVKQIHELHIWNISSRVISLSVHLICTSNTQKILKQAHELLKNKYNIHHTTIQIEKTTSNIPDD